MRTHTSRRIRPSASTSTSTSTSTRTHAVNGPRCCPLPTGLAACALLSAVLACLAGVPALEAVAAPPGPDVRPFEEQPYLGLSVRDGPGGSLVVGWVLPGPLGGEGARSQGGLQRDDNIVALDGEARTADGFRAYLRTRRPGDRVRIAWRRSPAANPARAVPAGGEGGEVQELAVVLEARSAWAGTLARGLAPGRTAPVAAEGAHEALVLEAAAALGARAGEEGLGGGLDALLARLAAVQQDALDTNSLPAVLQAFARPLSLDAVEAGVAAQVRTLADPQPARIVSALEGLLDVPRAGLEVPVAQALAGLAGGEREARRAAFERLLRTQRDSVSPFGPQAREHIQLLGQEHGVVARERLGLALSLLARLPAAWEARGAAVAAQATQPGATHPAARGDLLWAGTDEATGLALLVGGPGPNRYDMERVACVYDVGGDDAYVYGAGATAPLCVVIDLAGNDRHEAQADFVGPATSVLGLAWLDDRAGDDTYVARGQGSLAAGIGGLGVLLDRAGNDTYENRGPAAGWSLGVGFHGAGLLLDLAGSDTYRGEKLCQGVGGPLGVGLLLDVAGNDRYEADGPSFASAYGTPTVHVGMSQGFGYGVRGYAAGGLGALYDLGGDDRYSAGEFSQGGGYFFALGVLHDAEGNDLYHGNRYGQAFAAHQAIGVLVDGAGDDTYWSMTAASQSGAWDESITLLLDRSGHDSYQCDGLGQGSAAMQALALLVDLGGRDRYVGRGASVQGQGGNNTYHWEAQRVLSFSGLLDLGGADDHYSSGRANGTQVRTGARHAAAPGESDLYGVFVDR